MKLYNANSPFLALFKKTYHEQKIRPLKRKYEVETRYESIACVIAFKSRTVPFENKTKHIKLFLNICNMCNCI